MGIFGWIMENLSWILAAHFAGLWLFLGFLCVVFYRNKPGTVVMSGLRDWLPLLLWEIFAAAFVAMFVVVAYAKCKEPKPSSAECGGSLVSIGDGGEGPLVYLAKCEQCGKEYSNLFSRVTGRCTAPANQREIDKFRSSRLGIALEHYRNI